MNRERRARVLYALGATIVLFGIAHDMLAVAYAYQTRDIRVINIFDIIGVTLFFPQLRDSLQALVCSYLLFGIVFIGVWQWVKNKKSRW